MPFYARIILQFSLFFLKDFDIFVNRFEYGA